MAPPKWAVVATIDGPPALIASHATHHLWAGASHVYLYLERDCPDLQRMLAGLANVTVTICNPRYWAGQGMLPPPDQLSRESANAGHAAARAQVDYLLALGGTEFVQQIAPLEAELSSLPAGCALAIPRVERVDFEDSPRDGIFSQFFLWPDMRSGGGVQSSGVTARTITARPVGDCEVQATQMARHAVILHFGSMTPLHDQCRSREAGEAPSRVLTRVEQGELIRQGLLRQVAFDPSRALRALLPLDRVDLSCRQFDAWLKTTRSGVP